MTILHSTSQDLLLGAWVESMNQTAKDAHTKGIFFQMATKSCHCVLKTVPLWLPTVLWIKSTFFSVSFKVLQSEALAGKTPHLCPSLPHSAKNFLLPSSVRTSFVLPWRGVTAHADPVLCPPVGYSHSWRYLFGEAFSDAPGKVGPPPKLPHHPLCLSQWVPCIYCAMFI